MQLVVFESKIITEIKTKNREAHEPIDPKKCHVGQSLHDLLGTQSEFLFDLR
jgi:hypothetical protein